MSKIGATVEIFRHLPIDKVGPENLRQSLCYHAHHLTKAKYRVVFRCASIS